MAAPNRILSLNLGTQTVAVADFKAGPSGGLVLTNYKTSELLSDPALPDATRLAQAKLMLGEMVGPLGYKGQTVNYAISSQAIFTRFVKLPSVGEEQVDQIVTFEAQQNVPYPINEVVWDYQLVDSGDPSQVEVVIVAVKNDLLEEINEAVEGSTLETTVVDVAPMAIYNAFRYSYSDIGDGCSLLIDIGSRTTNLIFVEPHKIFSRSIPNGGMQITTAIAKEFGEPFAAAEERKKRDGFVSLGGAYAEPDDPDVARCSKMVRNAMTRLHAEIARSIGFYRSQQGGKQPQRVFLSGGSASLPYMREFFHEKLQLQVEYFNPLRNVSVAGNFNIEELGRQAHTLGELIGLALRGTSNCPMEMNLRPASVVKRHELAGRRPFLILAGVCLLALLACGYLYFTRAAAIANEVTGQLDEKVAPLKALDGRINAAKADIKAAEDAAAPLITAIDEKSFWPRIIDDINTRLPADYVWVTSFEPSIEAAAPAASTTKPAAGKPAAAPTGPKTKLILKGLYLYNEAKQAMVVDDFVAKLKESQLYTVDEENLKRSVPNDTEWGFDYEIPLVLKNPITLPPLQPK
jgi:type IV pilus assembly protein PilM